MVVANKMLFNCIWAFLCTYFFSIWIRPSFSGFWRLIIIKEIAYYYFSLRFILVPPFLNLRCLPMAKESDSYEIQMLAGVNKMCSQTPEPPQTSTHPTHLHVTEYLPPSHHHLQPLHFSCLSSPFISLSLCNIAAAGGALLLLPGKGRGGQAFTSPLPPAIISLICTLSLPLLLLLPPSHLFCLWHTAIGLESSEWGEARAELKHDGELLTLQLRELSAVGWLLAWTSSQAVLLLRAGRQKDIGKRKKS